MKKAIKFLIPFCSAALLFSGCGKVKPNGTYTFEKEKVKISFTFDDSTVTTNLDGNSAKCEYTIDDDGKISFQAEEDTSGVEELECTYEADSDVIVFQGYRFGKEEEKK